MGRSRVIVSVSAQRPLYQSNAVRINRNDTQKAVLLPGDDFGRRYWPSDKGAPGSPIIPSEKPYKVSDGRGRSLCMDANVSFFAFSCVLFPEMFFGLNKFSKELKYCKVGHLYHSLFDDGLFCDLCSFGAM